MANDNKFEITYKEFIDFMTRKRINVTFLERGFVDPILASTVSRIVTVRDQYEITFEQLFDIFCQNKKSISPTLDKEQFIESIQAMEIKTSVEDINELFNEIDVEGMNRITRQQFLTTLGGITSKIGSGSMETFYGKGILQMKKNVSNIQLVFRIMRKLADAIQNKKLTIGQLAKALDINGTGYLTRAEFNHVCHNLDENMTLDQIRTITNFFDDRNTGRISNIELCRVICEMLNNSIGGGVFAQLQVQPVIHKIIN